MNTYNPKDEQVYKTFPSEKTEVSSNSTPKAFFCREGVKKRKDEGLKQRLRLLIKNKRMSEPEFFHKLGISRQYWYGISWGLFDMTDALKLKIAHLLETDTSVIFPNKSPEVADGSQ